jgi:hypothetical protein
MTGDIPVIASSGNVFADLKVKNPEEALAKAKLVSPKEIVADRRCLDLRRRSAEDIEAAQRRAVRFLN